MKLHNMKQKRAALGKQAGTTLIELIAYIVIAALVLGAVIGVVALVRGDSKNDIEGKRIQFGMEKMLNYLATSSDTSSVTNALAIRIGAVPPDAVQAGNVITNKFGGNTTYAPASINAANDGVMATQTRLDEKACLNYTKMQGPSYTRVTVNGTVVKAATDTNIIEATLGTACGNTAAGNTVIFERLKS